MRSETLGSLHLKKDLFSSCKLKPGRVIICNFPLSSFNFFKSLSSWYLSDTFLLLIFFFVIILLFFYFSYIFSLPLFFLSVFFYFLPFLVSSFSFLFSSFLLLPPFLFSTYSFLLFFFLPPPFSSLFLLLSPPPSFIPSFLLLPFFFSFLLNYTPYFPHAIYINIIIFINMRVWYVYIYHLVLQICRAGWLFHSKHPISQRSPSWRYISPKGHSL